MPDSRLGFPKAGSEARRFGFRWRSTQPTLQSFLRGVLAPWLPCPQLVNVAKFIAICTYGALYWVADPVAVLSKVIRIKGTAISTAIG